MIERSRPSCPVCGGPGPFFTYLIWEGIRWDRCRSCSGGHQVPYVPEVEDDRLAAEQYDEAYLETAFFERRLRFAENQANWLARNFLPGMAVLEIGPGLGLAAGRFLDLEPDAEYHVVEPHAFFADFIKKRLGQRVTIHDGDPVTAFRRGVTAIGARNAPALVYMDNVLEHVADPREFLTKLKENLPGGSRLLIDVPNERLLKWRCRAYKAIGAEPTAVRGHINLFTPKAFRSMFGGMGLAHRVMQRGIRRPEDVNCIPEGPLLSATLRLLNWIPVDSILGVANNLRVEVSLP